MFVLVGWGLAINPSCRTEACSATSPTVVKALSLMEAITLQENRAKVDLDAFLLEFGPLKEVSGGKGKGPRRVLTLTELGPMRMRFKSAARWLFSMPFHS